MSLLRSRLKCVSWKKRLRNSWLKGCSEPTRRKGARCGNFLSLQNWSQVNNCPHSPRFVPSRGPNWCKFVHNCCNWPEGSDVLKSLGNWTLLSTLSRKSSHNDCHGMSSTIDVFQRDVYNWYLETLPLFVQISNSPSQKIIFCFCFLLLYVNSSRTMLYTTLMALDGMIFYFVRLCFTNWYHASIELGILKAVLVAWAQHGQRLQLAAE